jgi:hypothetical protein
MHEEIYCPRHLATIKLLLRRTLVLLKHNSAHNVLSTGRLNQLLSCSKRENIINQFVKNLPIPL